jgi:hypothetical protein
MSYLREVALILNRVKREAVFPCVANATAACAWRIRSIAMGKTVKVKRVGRKRLQFVARGISLADVTQLRLVVADFLSERRDGAAVLFLYFCLKRVSKDGRGKEQWTSR